LGKEYVENSMKSADEFNKPFQEFVTSIAGARAGRPGSRARTLDAQPCDISILNRPHELKLHIRARSPMAHQGPDPRDIMQVAIYAGVPAGVDAFRQAREVFAEQAKKP